MAASLMLTEDKDSVALCKKENVELQMSGWCRQSDLSVLQPSAVLYNSSLKTQLHM